ncbi:11090_t:CDS:1, partial [Dentiscutata heterogama]
CLYDLAGNAYFQEQNTKPNLQKYISKTIREEVGPIKDIFDYYYKEESSKNNSYKIGNLEEEQYKQIKNFLKQHSSSFA